MAKISSTISVPITLTFFLVVTTYATYQYRLFDIEFFIPWSKVRQRKTVFYRRIQETIAIIAEMQSVQEVLKLMANALSCQVAVLGGPKPLVALTDGQSKFVSSELMLSGFPRAMLEEVDRITIANEIADSHPGLHDAMKRYHIGAIVPFTGQRPGSRHWMLLGERFSEQVYTALDFKVVEKLFAAIADRFLDDFLLVRSQLSDAKDELREYRRRLAMAWDELTQLRKQAVTSENEARRLREENAKLHRRQFQIVTNQLPKEIISGEMTLHQYAERSEANIIREALRMCGGHEDKAARLLGMEDLKALYYLMDRYGIDASEYR